MTKMLHLGAMVLVAALAGRDATAADGDKTARLDALYEQYWEEYLELNPVAATFLGDPRYNDRLPNTLSEDYRRRRHDFNQRWLETVEAIGPEGLGEQDLISYRMFVRDAKQALESEKFPDWLLPVNQFRNLAGLMAQFGSGTGAQPFRSPDDYEDWRQRASRVPVLFDQAIANMRLGVERGIVQPEALMGNVVSQLDALIRDDAEETLFWKPVENMPASFSAEDRERITAGYRALIERELMPAYRKLRDYVAREYLPRTRETSEIGRAHV